MDATTTAVATAAAAVAATAAASAAAAEATATTSAETTRNEGRGVLLWALLPLSPSLLLWEGTGVLPPVNG